MIKTFGNKETGKKFNQVFSKKLPHSIQKTALRKLMMIDQSENLNDLRIPPANRLEALSGAREGLRINSQYRICFRYVNGDFYNVEITDYH